MNSVEKIARTLQRAKRLDREDPLRSFREKFWLPSGDNGRELIYLLGNSLGAQPKSAADWIQRDLDAWRTRGVEGHFAGSHPWMHYNEILRPQGAAILGALPSEVVFMNTLTVNLHFLLASFYRPRGDRTKILMESHAFPSDRYAAASHADLHGLDPAQTTIQLKTRTGAQTHGTEDIILELESRHQEIALFLLGGVNYYTGQLFELEVIARTCRELGITLGLDLAHAVGNVPLHLHDWEIDFAVWCTYKYLNGGPGSIGGAFVHSRHAENPSYPQLTGWWGHEEETRFEMPAKFLPAKGAEAWQVSNPPILAMSALGASLEIFEKTSMEKVRKKSIALTGLMYECLTEWNDGSFSIITPEAPDERGAQLSLRFEGAGRSVYSRLRDHGIVCDYREPEVIRAAPAPLYNTFEEVVRFAEVVTSRQPG